MHARSRVLVTAERQRIGRGMRVGREMVIDREIRIGRIPRVGADARMTAHAWPMAIGIVLMLILSIVPTTMDAQNGGSAGGPARTGQHAGTFEAEIRRGVEMKHLLFLPRGYVSDGRRWPLIVYLHGGSMRGTDPERLRRMGLPAVVEKDPDFPFIVLSPLLPERQLWTDTDALIALLDDVVRRHRIDPDRVYLTGHSVGGNGAWYLAYRHPDRFAAIAPMAGPAIPWWATRLKDVPVWAFHGDRDEIVPPRESREMVDALRAEGGDARLTVLEGRDHFILDAYENRELYAWLLRHTLASRRAAGPP
jgi:predicted esterase